MNGQTRMIAKPKNIFSLLLLIVMLLTVSAVLLWNAQNSYREFQTYQKQVMQESVNGTAKEITLFVERVRTVLHVLAESKNSDLQRLARNPDNEDLYNKISKQIAAYYPGYFYSFTIVDNNGQPIYDDFGDKIGDRCRQDLKKFATKKRKYGVYIHPGPFKAFFSKKLLGDRQYLLHRFFTVPRHITDPFTGKYSN